MPDIMHLLKINAPPERVYAALTTADGIRNWWTREAALDATTGMFSFYGGRVVTRVSVETLEPPHRVGWRTTASTAPGGWENTTITFDLRAEDGGAVLRFAHRGFAEENDGYARVTTGWAYFLISLKQYLETGQGAPAPDVDFTCVVKRPG
jgi:uncharacterized protein YndB with AHSA1/START domain